MAAPARPSFDSSLTTPIQFVKGVGPHRAELLKRMELQTARDVLFFFPRDYRDMSELRSISQLEENRPFSLVGQVEEVDLRNTGPGRCILGALIRQESGFLRAVWFNQPFRRQQLVRGKRVLLSGEAKFNGGRWEMIHPRIEPLGDDERVPAGRILPVYSLTEGLKQEAMRKIAHGVVEKYASELDEVFPEEYLAAHNLWTIYKALPEMHAPHDAESLARARRRFVYQELLVLQIALAMRRYLLTRRKSAPPLVVNDTIDRRIVRLFPWELTADQRRAIDEVCRDMAQPFPMNRLLQGDVASGKTVVAIYAMLLAVAHKHQAALMAPTEILARQHAETLAEQLRESRVRIGLLTGTLPAAERRRMLEEIAAGSIDLVVGTHAIVQDDVQFARLGLVIVDEQHKFGVRQRATLKHSGTDPHYLVMTATPIPRTMSMTLFGDLEVSTLREGPPGRQKVRTYIAAADKRDEWWEFFRNKLREGRQGYVIAPLVDESESVDAASVEQLLESLLDGPLHAFRLDLLHGRMSAVEKERAMHAFRAGQTQVLVATPVVEVGIDVPNATLMTIEGGERFGLSQLHQLRGRISRGAHPGHLCVFAEPTSEESQKRLAALAETTDGFKLAEVDFELRGPGDLFGARQHGLPPLRIADLVADREIVTEARRDAQALIENDPELEAPAYARLRKMVLVRYGKAMELGDVG